MKKIKFQNVDHGTLIYVIKIKKRIGKHKELLKNNYFCELKNLKTKIVSNGLNDTF